MVNANATLRGCQSHGLPNHAGGEVHLPLECTEDCCCLRCAAYSSKASSILDKDCVGDETSEPEDHRHGFDSQDNVGVVRYGLGEAPWDYD